MAHGPGTAELLRRIRDVVRTGGENLIIYNLGLTSLPELPPGIRFLSCAGNQLTTLPTLPATLTSLDCSDNRLIELPALPPTLNTLECANNQLTVLPALAHTSLMGIGCINNILGVLPDLPPSLGRLNCRRNLLPSLPALPPNLYNLNCEYNNLSVLPNLPPLLEYLECSHNRLIALPELPQTLTHLWCEHTRITALPALPPGLAVFSFKNNPIERVTLPFPPALHRFRIQEKFANTNLYRPDVTFGQYPAALEKWQTKQKAKDVRNTRLMADRVSIPTIVDGEHTYTKLPHGPESIIASMLSGIEKKNAAQQGDILKERAGIAGPAPNRKGFSGGRRRTIRRRRTKRSASKKMDTIL